jgi:hypothetical protein
MAVINFEQYDKDNPQIWQAFIHFTLQTMGKGFSRYSANGIFEVIRWHYAFKNGDKQFKVNNIYRPDYARKFMKQFPQHEGFFEIRELKAPRYKK